MFYKYFSIFSQISSSADNANAAAQASATDNAPHHTATSGTGQAGQNKNNNASSTSASENNSKTNPSNHVGGTDRPSSATADRSQNGEIDYRKVIIVFHYFGKIYFQIFYNTSFHKLTIITV